MADGETGITTATHPSAAGMEGVYDLQGRKLDGLRKPGVYIVNGRKVVMK